MLKFLLHHELMLLLLAVAVLAIVCILLSIHFTRRLRRKQGDVSLQRMVLDSTADGIYVIDPEGLCTWSNTPAARILGYDNPEAYLGRQMHDLIHHTYPDGTPYPASACVGLKGLHAGAGIMQSKELLWRADGSSFYAEVRANPVYRHGKPRFAVVVFHDITERLQLEEQYRRAAKMEAIGRMAAGAAHDFNNLLTVIQGYTQLLLEDSDLSEEIRRQLANIDEATNRAAVLTRRLLRFSRKDVPHPVQLQWNDVIASAEPVLRSAIGDQIQLEITLDPQLSPVTADASEAEQVIMNLAINARDAMPNGGRLRIRSRALPRSPAQLQAQGLRQGPCILVEIADSGTGMDEATRRQMFEPFFSTKPPGQGTGLGLAMVQNVVQKSGGAIRVISAPGQGTTIGIYLPVSPAASAAAAASGAQASSASILRASPVSGAESA